MSICSRRTFLGVAAVAVAGAGAGVGADFVVHPGPDRHRGSGGGAMSTTPANPPAAPELERALVREQALLAELTEAATANPALAARIAVLRADHQAHAATLAALITAAGATPSASLPPPSTPSIPSTGKQVTVADLIRWEKAAAVAVATDFDAATGTAAAVLASIYACEQTHVAWLS